MWDFLVNSNFDDTFYIPSPALSVKLQLALKSYIRDGQNSITMVHSLYIFYKKMVNNFKNKIQSL